MSENGPYKINSPDGVEHQVDFEVWLLNHIWRNRTFADNSYGDFRKLIEEEGLVIPTDLRVSGCASRNVNRATMKLARSH